MPGHSIGILSLDTAFPRIAGDVGNPASYPFKVLLEVVDGADSPLIVRDAAPDAHLLDTFKAAAQRLEARGVSAIVSTCGFLVTAQADIAAAVRIPVMLSALSMYPVVRATCPGRIGILTASRHALGPNALAASGIDPSAVVIAGLEDVAAFTAAILVTRDAQPNTLDSTTIGAEVVRRARDMQAQYTDLSAFIIECGNLPPYSDAVRQATGLPVFHLLDAARVLLAAQAGNQPS